MADNDRSLGERAEAYRKDFSRLRRRTGTPLAILIAVAVAGTLVWWFYDEIAKKPGVTDFVDWVRRKPIRSAEPGHLTIAITHLEDDQGREHENLLRDALANDFTSAEMKPIDRVVILPDAETDQLAVTKATQEARVLLKRAGADVLIWGRVVRLNGKSALRLYWTTRQELPNVKQNGSYAIETIALPPLFWDDLKQVLGVLVGSRMAALVQQFTGHYSANQLAPRKLLQDRQGSWTAETQAGVRFVFARALREYGTQMGDGSALRESIRSYQLITPFMHDQVPRDWATTQNSLGNALVSLGELSNDKAYLKEGIAAYRLALQKLRRESESDDWAIAQNNLGNALRMLAEREDNAARLVLLRDAVVALRLALEESPREAAPLSWAAVEANLGTALLQQGESDNDSLKMAVVAFRAALEEWTRQRVPLGWALVQTNLGSALASLGEREGNIVHLEEAVIAYREALKEYTRQRAPLGWALVQNNLGTVLAQLGGGKDGTKRLGEAVNVYQLALTERTRERVPLDWAMTQNNLGNALSLLGERESGTARLEEAVSAYRLALQESTQEHAPVRWAETQMNLGSALLALGRRESGVISLREAIAAYDAAIDIFISGGPASRVETCQANRQRAIALLTRRGGPQK